MKSLFSKIARPVVALSAVLTLSAASLLLSGCGAGVSEVANPAISTTVTAVVSPARVIAGQIYTYKATAPSGSSITWSWGDGSPDSVGSTVQKVWNKAGNQTVTLSATASGRAAAVTQTVAVSGEPVSAGRNHSCALQPSGSVLCWGNNSNGQLGGGANIPASITATVAVTGLTNAVALSAGALHSCAIRVGGTVVCWGDNSSGQMGDGTSGGTKPTPVAVTGLTGVVAISAGQSHTCALQSNGSAQCWGANIAGQIGDGTDGTGSNRATATAVIGLTDAVAISAGELYTCALKSNGTAACWGYNGGGQLGDGTIGNSRTTTVAVTGLTDAVALSAGYEHACALKANGSVACWGRNNSGEVGDNTTITRVVTTAVTGLTDAVAISAGGNANGGANGNLYRGRSCALKANGSAVCWGDKGYAGSGNGVVQAAPTAVAGLTDTTAISMGGDHTCALKASGAVACWGNNTFAQIGDGSVGGIQTNLVAVTAPGGLLTDILSVNTLDLHTCAVKTDGTVVCWGYNQFGQLGDGTTTTRTISAAVTGLADATKLATGALHTCAIKKDQTVVCWGNNELGQLGNGTNTSSLTPIAVSGLTDVLELSSGAYHTCARKADAVVCWGANDKGQLGNGTTTASLTPTAVSGLTGILEVSSGLRHTCVRKLDGVACWGANSEGQLGNGTTTASTTPTDVSGSLADVLQLSVGADHTCARKADGVLCWGNNDLGQLGNGTNTSSLTPTDVAGLKGVQEVSVGYSHTCARKADGVLCWGTNSNLQLGSVTTTPYSLTPVFVTGLTDVLELNAGASHSCARKADGVVCWGNNSFGKLGGSTFIDTSIKPRPTAVLGGAIFWK